MRITTKYIFLLIIIAFQIHAQNYWQSIDIFGGEIITLGVNNTTGNLYAARQDNVYRSTNSGNTWQLISSEDFFSYINDIAVSSNGYLFTGMQNGGIWWTSNNGVSWDFNSLHVGGQGQWASVNSIGINPSGHIFASTALTGHYRSNNNGASWQEFTIQGLSPFDGVNEYAFKTNLIFIATTIGVFRSANDGAFWELMGSTIGSANINSVTISSSGELFAGTRDSGVYFSSNDGVNWQNRSNGLINKNVVNIKITSDGKLFAATKGGGVYVSTDNGVSWQQAGSGSERIVNHICINNGNVFAGTITGIYKSTNNGNDWIASSNGIRLNNINSILSKPGGKLLVGTDWGIYFTSNNGSSWEIRSKNFPLEHKVVSAVKNTDGNIYTLTKKIFGSQTNSKIFRSSNDGTEWIDITSNLSNEIISHIKASANSLVALSTPTNTSFKLFISTNNGASWVVKNSRTSVIFNAVEMNTAGHIFLNYRDFGSNDTLLRSTDVGETWEALTNATINLTPIKLITINQFNSNIYAVRGTELRMSTDNGNSWTGTPIPWVTSFIQVTRLAFNSSAHIFAGTNKEGIFMSSNQGTNWINNNSGITVHYNGTDEVYSPITTLTFDNSEFIYAGTADDGIYKSSSSTVGVGNISGSLPKKFTLYQNYPNPFNPSTTILYSIPTESNVELKIFNMLGQTVETLVNQFQKAGNYKAVFDGSKLSSGIYTYRISAGSYVETKKMILIK